MRVASRDDASRVWRLRSLTPRSRFLRSERRGFAAGQELDDWLAAFHIQPAARHDALLDALAAAELLLVLLARARGKGLRTVEEALAAAGKIPL